jgi:hypothetical protein
LAHAPGQKGEAEKPILEVEESARHRYFCPHEIGAAYVTLGDPDTAVKWFRKVWRIADCMAWLGVEPWIESFRRTHDMRTCCAIGLAPRPAAAAR